MSREILYGVIASAVAWVLSWIVRRWLVPRYRALTFGGTNISGPWDAYYEGASEPGARITFRQSGRTISGDAHVTKSKRGELRDRQYRYWGRCLNSSITLLFEDRNNPGVLGGSMVLDTLNNSDANCMKGLTVFYKPEEKDVVFSRVELWKAGVTPRRPSAVTPKEEVQV